MIKKVVIFRISLIVILVLSLVIVIKLNIENFSSIIKILRMLICTECIITFSYFIEMKRNVKKDSNDISLLFGNDKRITERQKICLRNLIYENETYKSLAATLCVSESTIKKDMTDLYGIFNVKSKNELKKQLLGMDNNIKKLLFNEKDGEIV